MLRPYLGKNLTQSRRIFNYRLSRARRIVENAFGILAAQWRIYHRVIGVSPEKVDWIVKATVALHNYQRWNSTPQADPAVDAEASPALQELRRSAPTTPPKKHLLCGRSSATTSCLLLVKCPGRTTSTTSPDLPAIF